MQPLPLDAVLSYGSRPSVEVRTARPLGDILSQNLRSRENCVPATNSLMMFALRG